MDEVETKRVAGPIVIGVMFAVFAGLGFLLYTLLKSH